MWVINRINISYLTTERFYMDFPKLPEETAYNFATVCTLPFTCVCLKTLF